MGSLDNIVFKNKKFSDILNEIYDNQKKKEKQISGLISELKPLISDIGDATLIVPLIKEYLEIGIKNDEHLIKMASIIQRLENANSNNDDSFDPSEIEALIKEVENSDQALESKKEELVEDGLQS